MAQQIQNGSNVMLHYTLMVEGTQVDSSREGQPLSFVVGKGQLIPGFETRLIGLSQGEKKQIDVPAEEAYGQPDPEALVQVPKSSFSEGKDLKVGDMVQGQQGTQVFRATVKDVKDDSVTLDFNHPLAGKNLSFDVEILDVKDPSPTSLN